MLEDAERKRITSVLDQLVTVLTLIVEKWPAGHSKTELLSQLDSIHFDIEKIRDGQNE